MAVERGGRVGDAASVDGVAHVGVALVVGERADGPVYGQFGEVGTAESAELGVEIGEVAPLQERVVGEVDTGHDVGGVEGDLLGFGEVVVRVTIEGHLADAAHGQDLFGPEFGGVEDIEVEFLFVCFGDGLDAELPFEIVALLDGLPHVASMEVGIFASDLLGFVPDERMDAEDGFPVELDEGDFALCVDEPEGVDSEAFHHAETAREGTVAHDPHHHVHGFGGERDEIVEGVVGGSGLRDLVVGLGFDGVDQIREFDGVPG